MTEFPHSEVPSAERSFLDTMEDLRLKTDLRATEYQMSQAGGLVRRLIIDRHSLASTVNQKPHLRIRYVVGDMRVAIALPTETRGSIWCQGPWLDAALSRLHRLRREAAKQTAGLPGFDEFPDFKPLTLDQFLKVDAVSAAANPDGSGEQVVATVLDVIKLYANQLGGVHWDMRREPSELLADTLATSAPFLGQTMIAIGRTVYRALEPLAHWVVLAPRPHPFGLAGIG